MKKISDMMKHSPVVPSFRKQEGGSNVRIRGSVERKVFFNARKIGEAPVFFARRQLRCLLRFDDGLLFRHRFNRITSRGQWTELGSWVEVADWIHYFFGTGFISVPVPFRHRQASLFGHCDADKRCC
ncbi:hypothetical protein D3C86_1811090 [compost metagenome]